MDANAEECQQEYVEKRSVQNGEAVDAGEDG